MIFREEKHMQKYFEITFSKIKETREI